MATALYDTLGLPTVQARKLKPRSTAHAALEKLKDKHPVISVIMTYRRIAKMKSSYVDNILGFLDIEDRVHGSFKIPGTEVGRISIADPALQTIPRPDDYFGAAIRSAFIPRIGWKLGVVDYSQAELRVFTCASMDPFLLQVYREGRDLHSEVAIGMYGPNYTKPQRVQCKMFNFSYLYGGNEYSFAQDSGLNIDIAKQFVKDYNRLMPVALEYKREQYRKLKADGYVTSVFGRRRRFPLITPENADEARKACVHMPTAATANDLTLLSAVQANKEGIRVLVTVHDSVIFEAPPNEIEAQGLRVAEIMRTKGDQYLPQVPWKVDVDISDRWAKPWIDRNTPPAKED